MRDRIYDYLLGLLPNGKANAMTIGIYLGEAKHSAVLAVSDTLDELDELGWVEKAGEFYTAVPGKRGMPVEEDNA